MADSNRTAETLAKLSEGVASLCSSERWLEYLAVARTFHDYSFSNVLLVHRQAPWASRVAGFHTWRKLGRVVRKGERAIWILAPITMRRRPDDQAKDVEPDDRERVVVSFKAVPVFDISQTDGDALPEPPCSRLTGDDPDGAYDRLRAVALELGYVVEEDYLPGETNGDCNFAEHRIRVEVTNDPRMQVKTLLHELGHALLHIDGTIPRGQAELEAESVAYVVGEEALGLDTAAYSFGYLATWAGGSDEALKAIAASGKRIQSAVKTLIEALAEPATEEMQAA